MRKVLIITDNEIDTIIQIDHILHLEAHEYSFFFSTKYADYSLRNANYKCDGDYDKCDCISDAITTFYGDNHKCQFWTGKLQIEIKESK